MTYFKMPLDWDEMTEELTLEEKGRLICAMVAYAKGEEYLLSGNERFVFTHYKKLIAYDKEVADKTAIVSRSNGKKGGRPKTQKTQQVFEKPRETQRNPEEKEGEKEKAKENEKESNKEKDKEKEKEREPEKEAHIGCARVRPSLEEVRAYCKERGNRVDADAFCNYYTANGWRVGKNPMKDWKAAVRTWENNGIDNKRGEKGESGNVFADYKPLTGFRHGNV